MEFVRYYPKKTLVSMMNILLLIILASCGTNVTEIPSIPTATIFVELPTLTSTIPPTETLVPTMTQTPFVPKATIRIAGHVPLSGEWGNFGMDLMRSAELAVSQLSDPLMELGYKIELVQYDDKADVNLAVTNAQQIVADPTVLCIVGPLTSNILNQTKEIYHQAGLPLVSPSATANNITSSGYLEVNRVVGRNDMEAIAGGQFLQSQNFSKVFIISQTGDPSQLSDTLHQELNIIGISVVGDMVTDEMENFETYIESLIASNADVVYFNTFSVEQAGKFFRDARAEGYMGAFLGSSLLNNPVLLDFAGPLLVEGGGMYILDQIAAAKDYPQAAEFYKEFETMYGSPPWGFSGKAYDSAGICLAAIGNASRAKDGEIPTRAEVANAIRAIQEYQGITGTYTFNNLGELTYAKYFIYKVAYFDTNKWDQNILAASIDIVPPK